MSGRVGHARVAAPRSRRAAPPQSTRPAAGAPVGSRRVDAEILAAVAPRRPRWSTLSTELVAAPTVLGERGAPARRSCARAFADARARAVRRAARPGRAGRRIRRGARSAGTSTARPTSSPPGSPRAPAGGRSLILNGHVDVVSPEPASLWTRRPVRRPARRRVALRARRRRHEGGPRRDRRRGRRPAAARRRAARAGAAPVRRRGGVHRQRRARVRARGPHRRRGDPHRADAAARCGTRRSASCGSRCACSARRPTPARRAPARTRSRRPTR